MWLFFSIISYLIQTFHVYQPASLSSSLIFPLFILNENVQYFSLKMIKIVFMVAVFFFSLPPNKNQKQNKEWLMPLMSIQQDGIKCS